MISLIVCIDKSNRIGLKDGQQLYNIKDDLKHFMQYTTERKNMIVGRKTYNEMLGRIKERNGRRFLVLSRTLEKLECSEDLLFRTFEELLQYCKDNDSEDYVVCGGAEVYTQFLMSGVVEHVERTLVELMSFSHHVRYVTLNLYCNDNIALIPQPETKRVVVGLDEHGWEICATICGYKVENNGKG